MGIFDWCVGFGSVLLSFITFLFMNRVDNYADPIFRLTTWFSKLAFPFSPYLQLTISEHGAERFQRSELFLAVEAYLSKVCANRARKLKADIGRGRLLQVKVDDRDEVADTFVDDEGTTTTVWWYASKKNPRHNIISFYPSQEESSFYQVVFHRRHRNVVIDKYLPHVLDKGSEACIKNRPHRLFTNKPSSKWNPGSASWSHVAFQHPASFDTLAMEDTEKQAILDDLKAFQDAEEYYKKVGKAWKRGYLLYGPPGTGKSTMIAAMANHLKYDVYDLELTAVKNNTELRKLFIETKSRSIIVIEDMDNSVDLTGKRKDKKSDVQDSDNDPSLPIDPDKDEGSTKMTLSGVLNFVDGLWSACGGERIIIFTTNNKDKLDQALIRRGRMDMEIKMSYCRFEAFKVLAKNYLAVEEHSLFSDIRRLLVETQVAPADVAEYLMLTSSKNKGNPDTCLKRLVEFLEKAHEEAKDKALAGAKRSKEEAADATRSAQEDAEAAEAREGRKEDERKDEITSDSEGRAVTVHHMTTVGSPSLIQVDSNEWVLDTRSLIHYTSNLRLLHELTKDDHQADQLQRGSVQTELFKVPEVSYVQGGSSRNVISVAQLASRHGLVTVFEPTCAYVRDHRATGQDALVGHAHLSNGIYVLDYLFIQMNKGGSHTEHKEAEGSGGGGVGRSGGNGDDDDDTKGGGASGGDGGTIGGGGGGGQNEGTGERDNSGTGGEEDEAKEMEDQSHIAMFGQPRFDRTHELNLRVFSTSINELGRTKAFYVDSGAENHVTWNGDVLFRYPQHLSVNTTKQFITGVSGSSLTVGGIGYIVSAGGSLDHVLFVPDSVANLVSVSQLSRDYSARVEFYIEKMWIERIQTGERIGQGYLVGGLYVLDLFDAECLVQRSPA